MSILEWFMNLLLKNDAKWYHGGPKLSKHWMNLYTVDVSWQTFFRSLSFPIVSFF